MENFRSSATIKHKDDQNTYCQDVRGEGGVGLRIPGVCIVCLYMYLYILIYICSETILTIVN